MSVATTVWAPAASRVHIETGGHRRSMDSLGGGWWRAPEPVSPGDDYRFVLDDSGPLPDPRSPWQPQGVHGPSRALDHGAFRWSDAAFRARPLGSAVIYELHVGTFTAAGTFDAAIDRLPYLRDLGVTHVELMPVNAFPGERGWGYDGVGLYAPHEAMGGPEGLKRLVSACHARDLAVLLDVVYNHLGPDGNYLGRFGPYFTDHYHTPWGAAVNLDGSGSDEVRRFFCDNALMWLRDYHFDGVRVDAVHAFHDRSAEPFLAQLAREVHELSLASGRPLVVIAESDLNDPRVVASPEAGGMGCDAQWSDDLHHALHALLTNERGGYYTDFGTMDHVKKALESTFVFDGVHSRHRGRRHGRPSRGVPKQRFLAYLQSHDQVGNRARGERIGHLVSPGRARIGAALVLTSPYVPMLFMGEEWGSASPFQYFTDHGAPGLGDAVREGRRREFAAFGWDPEEVPDPQDPQTFERSKLHWEELQEPTHQEMLQWYRELLQLRRERPDLLQEGVVVRMDEAAGWLVVERPATTIVCNLSDGERRVPIGRRGPPHAALLASLPDARLEGTVAVLPPESVLITG
jgi:maltooligosyltrehalose trehalohydrolase